MVNVEISVNKVLLAKKERKVNDLFSICNALSEC